MIGDDSKEVMQSSTLIHRGFSPRKPSDVIGSGEKTGLLRSLHQKGALRLNEIRQRVNLFIRERSWLDRGTGVMIEKIFPAIVVTAEVAESEDEYRKYSCR